MKPRVDLHREETVPESSIRLSRAHLRPAAWALSAAAIGCVNSRNDESMKEPGTLEYVAANCASHSLLESLTQDPEAAQHAPNRTSRYPPTLPRTLLTQSTGKSGLGTTLQSNRHPSVTRHWWPSDSRWLKISGSRKLDARS